MSTIKDGGPAFPCLVAYNAPNEGMSMRDYFAAQAVIALLSARPYAPTAAAEEAYEVADAMLKARQKQ